MINIVWAKKFYHHKTIFLHHFVVYGIYSLLIGKSFLFFSFCSPSLIFPCHSDIHSSLRRDLRPLTNLPEIFGIYNHLNETSSNLILGALDALPTLLPQTPSPSSELLATLKQPFDSTVTSRMPSSSRNALGIIHDYLIVSAPIIYICE